MAERTQFAGIANSLTGDTLAVMLNNPPKKYILMEEIQKAQIMHEHLLTQQTFVALQDEDPKFIKIEPLRIYRDLILILNEEDFNRIQTENIFLSAFFGPATNSITSVGVPANSKVITFDHGKLLEFERDERIAVILHEYGHAFNPALKNKEGEFAADDFAITKGFGKAIKSCLEKNIIENALNFDKEINRERIARIDEFLKE